MRPRLKPLGILLSALLASTPSALLANSSTHIAGPRLTYGTSVHGQGIISDLTNPAVASIYSRRMDADDSISGSTSLALGVEYGNVDGLFDLIDSLRGINGSGGDNGGDNGGGDNGGGDNGGGDNGIDIDIDIDWDNPDLQALIKGIRKEASILGSVLAFVAADGYANAYVASNANFIINPDIWGGTLSFSLHGSATSAAFGMYDPINFDEDQALRELEAAFNLGPNSPRTTFDLSGGILLTVDPANNDIEVEFNNDSLLLTQAAKVVELGFGYSREVYQSDAGHLIVGIRPKHSWFGLTRVSTRIGDITDSESLFNDIRHAEFDYQSRLGLDLGAVWQSDNYALGASLLNVFEPTFTFPTYGRSRLSSSVIVEQLDKTRRFTLERQLKLEGSAFTTDRHWVLNLALDANEASDPMQADSQWASVSGGYYSGSWWLPNIRLGYHQNLIGTELNYLAAGVALFRYLNLDVVSSTHTTEFDGKEYPRALGGSLGVSFAF